MSLTMADVAEYMYEEDAAEFAFGSRSRRRKKRRGLLKAAALGVGGAAALGGGGYLAFKNRKAIGKGIRAGRARVGAAISGESGRRLIGMQQRKAPRNANKKKNDTMKAGLKALAY